MTFVRFLYAILAVAAVGECFMLMGLRDDTDMYIREKMDRNCQWFNSGIMGLIPRRFNDTTLCRCRLIGVYECSTVIVHTTTQAPAAKQASSGAPSDGQAASRNSSVSVISNSIIDAIKSKPTVSSPPPSSPAIELNIAETKKMTLTTEKPSSLNLTSS